MSKRTIGLLGAAAIVLVGAAIIILASTGDDDSAEASETDGAFIAEMVPHHRSAIEMAEIARRRAEHPQIEDLAEEIIDAQSSEIDLLEVDHERIFGEPLAAMGAEHGDLGLPAHEAGMDADTAELAEAKPFDRAFIDMMIPHHQGAIRMARIELEQGEDEELTELATAIIEAQSHEIEEMNSWRERWYGTPSPAGGVPPEDEEIIPSHGEMGHE
jgi:uncharacterized protein (DUF305 family)